MSPERLTKLIVVVWACAALALQAWLLRILGLSDVIVGVFALAFVATWIDRRSIGLVLVFTYIFPVVIWRLTDGWQAETGVVWMAALLGAILPDAIRTPWHIPARWRAALVCWALVIATAVVLVIWRETDFTLALFADRAIPNTSRGTSPPGLSLSVLHAALILVLGILWVDWLFGARSANLRTIVLMPLGVSCFMMAAVAIFQMSYDITYLNATLFAVLNRATGTVLDGNVCGAIAALWLGGAVWLTEEGSRARPYVIGVAWTVLLLAIWASGSRSAFAGGMLIMGASLLGPSSGKSHRRLVIAGVLIAGVLVVAMWVFSPFHFAVAGPLSRMPAPTVADMRVFVSDLWDRQRYGTAAVAMIRQFPWSGVGIGCYVPLLVDFGGPVTPDNAQNWFRHQVAELGVLGSLAWIVWVIAFAIVVFRIRRNETMAVWAGRGVLVGFAFMSLFGMPGQDVSVVITFWVAVFWFANGVIPTAPAVPIGRWSWLAVAAVVVAFGCVTTYAAHDGLRVPTRAQRFGWPYEHGFYPPAPGAIGNERWTMRQAVAVVDAPTRWMLLTASVNPLALTVGADRTRTTPIRPVDVKVWRDGELVLQAHLVSTAPATTMIAVPDGEPRVLLETWTSRPIDPRSVGVADDRELGALISWRFIDQP